jgi:ParB family chromosome partitioning protein
MAKPLFGDGKNPFDISKFTSQDNQYTLIPSSLLVYNNEYERYEGEQYNDMCESIRNHGVLQPLIVRPTSDGKYTILSGNNRRFCGEAVGLTSFPCVIKQNISDEEAQAYIDETNVYQRGFASLKVSKQAEVIARRYSEMFDNRKLKEIQREIAMMEGKELPEEENISTENEQPNSRIGRVGAEYGLDKNSVSRLIRINCLIPDLKVFVDNERIKALPVLKKRTAVDLSFISDELQQVVADYLKENPTTNIDMKMSSLILAQHKADTLNKEVLLSILNGTFNNKPKKTKSISLKASMLKRFYLDTCSEEEALQTIETALTYYYAERGLAERKKK